jgi:hypothetical protein
MAGRHWLGDLYFRCQSVSVRNPVAVLPHEFRLDPDPLGHVGGTKLGLNWRFPVVGTGVDPVTSRFSGARSTN